MKSIIVEGPNGAGKSTLGKAIAETFGWKYVHAGPSPGNNDEAIIACIDQFRTLRNGPVVMDRCTPISRRVYELPLSSDHERMLETWCKVLCDEALIVYCTGEGEFHEKEYYPEGHFEEIVSKRQFIRDRYEDLMVDIPHIKYNWVTDPYLNFMERLRNAADDR